MSQDKQNQKSTGTSQPSVGRLALPVWILMVAVLLGYRGCIYVDNVGGGLSFSPQLYGPYTSVAELQNVQPQTGGLADIQRKGKAVYGTICVGCHQSTGLGVAGQFPPLAGSEWITDQGPNRVVRIVLHGLQGPISVSGKQYGAVAMTALGDSLSDADIAAVLTFIKNNAEWGNETGELVTPEQVVAIRAETAGRKKNWTAPELLQIPLQ